MMKAKRIIACVISFILFTMCIQFTAVAEDMDTGLDRYRKYYSPTYTLETDEENIVFWDNVKHYDDAFPALKEMLGVTDGDFYFYQEDPLMFGYTQYISSDDNILSNVSEQDISSYNPFACYDFQLDQYTFSVHDGVTSAIIDKDSDWNNKVLKTANIFNRGDCETYKYIITDTGNLKYSEYDGYMPYDKVFNGKLFRSLNTSYRYATFCSLITDKKIAYVVKLDCNVNKAELDDLNSMWQGYGWYFDWDYDVCKSDSLFDYGDNRGLRYGTGCNGFICEDYDMITNKGIVSVTYSYDNAYRNDCNGVLNFQTELDPNINYDKNLKVYEDKFMVSVPVNTDDGVRFIDNDYTIMFWYDGSFQIVDSGETASSVTETSFYWNKKETDYKNSTSISQYVNGKYQNVDKVQTYGDTLNYDADNDRLCTISNGKITYLTENQLHYTLNIYADNGIETTKVASYDIQLFAPQQRRTIIYNTMTQEPPVVDPVTEYQYKTITYNNGSYAYRIKTNSDVSDIQEYIDKLEAENALLRQENTEYKNKINLLATGTYGDVNSDAVVDVQDAQIILAYYTERDVAKKSVPDLVTFGLKFGKE